MPTPHHTPVCHGDDNDGDLTPRPLDEIFAAHPMVPPPLPPLKPLALMSIWDSDMIQKFRGAVATAKVSGMSAMPQRPLVMSQVL